MMDRYVELFQTYENQLACAQSLDNNSLAVICTIGGSYFSHYNEIAKSIFSSGAKVAILTQSVGSMYINRADYVIKCGESNQNDIGKYTSLAVIDNIVMQYLKRHGKKE